MKKLALALAASLMLTLPMSAQAKAAAPVEKKTLSAEEAIVSVKSYGFVDLEGAKLSHIILEYADDIDAASVSLDDYSVMDYVRFEEEANGYENTIEVDYDDVQGNEGLPVNVYVNNEATPSEEGGVETGKYVVLEVNTDYMLSGQNLVYTASMMAGVTQVGIVSGEAIEVTPSENEIGNYTVEQYEISNAWGTRMVTDIATEKENIILPEFGPGSGWTLNYIGDGAFQATHCYSEYTGQYVDFELPYSIFMPSQEILDANKGHVAIVVHMEHAGSNDTDPMAAITSSKAAVKLSSEAVQSNGPAIIVVPQIEEDRRSTDDYDASSEANTAVWELLDYLLEEYKDYIDTNRIYGTGQSMGGMTILNMAAQRDNFFGGIAVIGAQWSTNYSKEFQHNNAPIRTPENDPISFNGFGLDAENFQNWYYMVSDDNIMVHTCAGDPMATGEWAYLAEYFEMAGGYVAQDEWDPYSSLDEQYAKDVALTEGDHSAPGTGIFWGRFDRGSHMSTWKYGYQLDYPLEWLFAQTRETEEARGKLEQLKNDWLGRDENGNILEGSGTTGLNAAQYTPGGPNPAYAEGWTPVSATQALIDALPEEITEKDQRNLNAAKGAYNNLSDAEKAEITGAEKLEQTK